MQQIQLKDQILQDQITLICLDIDEKIIESDEDIITELQAALKNSKEDDYNQVMVYLNQIYANRSFLIKGNFLIQNQEKRDEEIQLNDYRQIFKELEKDKDYVKILQLMKNNAFCIENKISKIIQQNIDILSKLGDNLQDFFDIYLSLQVEDLQETHLTQFQLIAKLIGLIYHPLLSVDELCCLEQLLGSLLINQIYEFELYLDQLAEQSKDNSFDQFVKDLQQQKVADQLFVCQQNEDLLFLSKLFTLDIRTSRNNLNQYFQNILMLSNKQLSGQSIIEELEAFVITRINIQQCYYVLVWHLWAQYSFFYKLTDEFNKLIGNIKILKEENRKLGVFQRFLKKQKQTGDEILTYFVHRAVYFSVQKDEFFNKKEEYEKYKYQQTELLMKQDQLKKTTLCEFLTISSKEFVIFCELIQQLQFKDILLKDQEQILQHFILFLWRMRINESAYEKLQLIFQTSDLTLLSCASMIKLQFKTFSKYEVMNLLSIASKYHNFIEENLSLIKKFYNHFGTFEQGKIMIQFNHIIKQKVKTQEQIRGIYQLKIEFWQKISIVFDNQSLIKLANDLLSQYQQKKDKNLQRLVFHRIFHKVFSIIDVNDTIELKCFKILFQKVQHKSLHQILKQKCQGQIPLSIFNLTTETLKTLHLLLPADTLEFLFKNLKLLLDNQLYNFEFMHSLLVRKIDPQLIQMIVNSHYLFANQSFEQLISNCYKVFIQNEELYSEWLKPFNYFDYFFITPLMLKKKQCSEQYPFEINIQLEDFNISLAELTETQQEIIICDWIDKMNDKEKFLNLIPFYFNIIKRGESPDQLLSLIQSKKTQQITGFFNMKSLFQILYNNSNDELKVMLLKFWAKVSPIPLIYQNPNYQSVKNEQDLFLFNQYLFYVFPKCYSIINLTLSKKVSQIGKTQLINKVFYQMKRFEICDTCEINKNTVDIMFDICFNGSRHLAVADVHGLIPEEILSKILNLFRLWIIQMNSETELEENYARLINLQQKVTDKTIKVCFIVRNSSSSLKLQYKTIIEKIKIAGVAIHFIQNLTLSGLDQQIQQNEVENVSKFIYSQIQPNYFREEHVYSSNFLTVLKTFNEKYQLMSLKIEADNEIIKSLEDELKYLVDQEDGFYCLEAFPLRCLEAKIKAKREELLKKRMQASESNENVVNIQQDLENLEKQIIQNRQTKILHLFCKIFDNENSYILYLWFVDRLRQFNDEKTYQLLDQNVQLNEEMQKAKKEKNSIKKNNDSSTDNLLQEANDKLNLLKQKLDDNLRILSLRNIGIEIFWRELIQQTQLCRQFQYLINPAEIIFQMIKKGEPFEFLDGDSLKINACFLQQLASRLEFGGKERILVLSVLGPQSSGKSTILNKIFGCHFWTSVGRCTKGIYLQLLKVHAKQQFNNMFDYILILDTEGLQNPNQQDPEFDKTIALFILAISDIILINVKGDIHQQFRSLVEMCIYTLGHMKNEFSYVKQLSWCFNQNNDVNNFAPFLDQIQGIASNLNKEYLNNDAQNEKLDYNEFLDIKKENIQILGFSSYEKSWKCNKNLGIFQEWRQQITNDTFSSEAYHYGVHIIKSFVQKFQQTSENESMSNLNLFINNIASIWQSIQLLPDLLEFSELIQHQQNQFMKEKFEEILENKRKEFTFIDDIRKNIQKAVQLNQKKTIRLFSQIQEDQERIVSNQFEILRKQIEEDLNSQKQQNKISKKITQKYIRQLEHKINSQKSEYKMYILEAIKNYERQYQENQGFAQIDTFVEELSSKNEQLKQYQDRPELINEKFKYLWQQITTKLDEQQGSMFDEFQLNQYQSITQVFTQYTLTTNHEQHFQKFFSGINKINPQENQLEKENIFKIFLPELEHFQQFMILDKHQKNIRYNDIFYLPILEKLKRSTKEHLVDISQFYQYCATWEVIEKQAIQDYLYKGFQEDMAEIVLKCKKSKKFNLVYSFFCILDRFKISHDSELKQKLIDIIINPKLLTLEKSDIQIEDAFQQFFESINFEPQHSIFLEDTEFIMHFDQFYPNLKTILSNQQRFPSMDQVLTHRIELLKHYIILKETVKVKSTDDLNTSFSEYVMNPTNCTNSNVYQSKVVEKFHEILLKTGGWQHLYSLIYDIIKNEMFKVQMSDSENQYNDDSFTFSNSLIKIIMSKIELQVVQFNEQFSTYGVIFKDLGERCVYFYSLLIIWRFGCFKKWKMLENKCKLQKLYDTELEKFRAEIMQNKAEQSKFKAQTLVNDIFQSFLDGFYTEKSSIVATQINSRSKSCKQLMSQLDEILLEKSFQQTPNVQDIILYVREQRKYIEDYVNQQIISLQNELTQQYEQQLQSELFQFFRQILQNANTLKNQIIDNVKIIDYFVKVEKKIGFYESYLYQIVIDCLQGEQKQDLNILDEQYRDLFKNNFNKIQIQILTRIRNPSDQQIQQLKYFISEVSDQIEFKINNIQQCVKLNLSTFNIQTQFDDLRLKMNGCQKSCPICMRKCDQDNDAHQKHMCENGHLLRGMRGVLIGNRPSLFTCEEIGDDALITTKETQQTKTWKDIMQMYEDWHFKSHTQQDLQKHKKKMMKVWNEGIGKEMCQWLSQELSQNVEFQLKHDLGENFNLSEPVHYILMLDDSGSMGGTRWQNARNGAISCMNDIGQNINAKVSVIIFNTTARVVIDCQKFNCGSQSQLITFDGGGTSFQNAFNCAYKQICKYQANQFSWINILFYTDGGDSYPSSEIEAFCNMQENVRKTITLIACTEESSAPVLSQIVEKVKSYFYRSELKKSIQASSIKQAWSEVVSQNYHKLRC